MEAGSKHSPILDALHETHGETSGQIRVHLSRRYWERSPMKRAQALFLRHELDRHAGGILIYVNLRKRKFAIAAGEGVSLVMGQNDWENLSRKLSQELRSTHPERAIAWAITEIGKRLRTRFPAR